MHRSIHFWKLKKLNYEAWHFRDFPMDFWLAQSNYDYIPNKK